MSSGSLDRDDNLVCARCAQAIKEDYALVGGKPHHKHCFDVTPCPGCAERILGGEIAMVDGREWHRYCYDKSEAARRAQAAAATAAAGGGGGGGRPTCAGCASTIESGQVLQQGAAYYHPACFKCARCSQPITGSYSLYQNRVHCAACMTAIKGDAAAAQQQQQRAQQQQREQQQAAAAAAKQQAATAAASAANPPCAACAKPVVGRALTVNNAPYHAECFRCSRCAGAIDGAFKVDAQQRPVCATCAASPATGSASSSSSSSSSPSSSSSSSVMCAECAQPIVGSYAALGNDKYCERCVPVIERRRADEAAARTRAAAADAAAAGQQAPIAAPAGPCGQCKKAIADNELFKSYAGRRYHDTCLCCKACRMPLPKTFHDRDGALYCADDYRRLFSTACPVCATDIDPPRAVPYDDTLYHSDCWVCFECKGPLTVVDKAGVSRIQLIERRPYCAQHYAEYWQKQ